MKVLMAKDIKQAKNSLISSLKRGKTPVIRYYFDGVEEIIRSFGIDPKMVFIPRPEMTQEEISIERRRFRQKNNYKLLRGEVGVYSPRKQQAQKDEEILERAKRRILIRLQEEQ